MLTKKIKISLLVLIWGIVAIQSYINWKDTIKANVVETFAATEETKEENCIRGFAYLGTDNLTDGQKEEILKKLAKKLNIPEDFRIVKITKDGYVQWSLEPEEASGTLLQITTLEEEGENSQSFGLYADKEENYLFVELYTKESWEEAKKTYRKIHTICTDVGVSANVNIERTLVKKGNLQKDKKRREACVKELFETEQAEAVDEMVTSDFCSVYGYAENEDYITNLNGKKVNRQIVFSYSESDHVTYVKLGCPIVNSIY